MRFRIVYLLLVILLLTGCGNDKSLSDISDKIDKANKEIETLKAENEKLKKESPTVETATDGLTVESTPDPQSSVANSDEPPTDNVAVYYKNCTAVRAAGAAPLYQGDPGYSTKLDRDKDGVACE